MRQLSPPINANETQDTEKAPFLVVKRVREAILDEHLPNPALPSNEGSYLARHIAPGVTSADLSMIDPRRFENRRIEVIRFEVTFKLSPGISHTVNL